MLDYIKNVRSLKVVVLLVLQQPSFEIRIINLALLDLLLHNFENSLLNFFLDEGFIDIPDVGGCFVESALDIFADKILEKRSDCWIVVNPEALDGELVSFFILVGNKELVAGRKPNYSELLHCKRIYFIS